MIARLTHLAILLQLIMLAVLSALFFSLGWIDSFAISLLCAAAMLTLMRASIVFNNFFLSGALRQPMGDGQPAPLIAAAASMLQEFWYSMVCWFQLFPLARPFHINFAEDTSPPVLLLHGYGANSGFWKPLSKRLSGAGISHAAIDLEPILGSIDDYADLIERSAQQLCNDNGVETIIVVGHSMGGLAARAWLRRYGTAKVASIITLGTPHFGSTLAGYGMGKNAREMLPHVSGTSTENHWLTALANSESTEDRAKMRSIYSRHDNIVSPQQSAQLPGAINVAFDLIGHVALGFDREVIKVLMTEITTTRQSRCSAGMR
jgi:triacylglycerol esterase/lipase EstA (alpha/beta hydrolase family)